MKYSDRLFHPIDESYQIMDEACMDFYYDNITEETFMTILSEETQNNQSVRDKIADKIANLRKLYSKYLEKSRSISDPGIANKFKYIAQKILSIIDAFAGAAESLIRPGTGLRPSNTQKNLNHINNLLRTEQKTKEDICKAADEIEKKYSAMTGSKGIKFPDTKEEIMKAISDPNIHFIF